jgi:CheY-like chemotaxis protein
VRAGAGERELRAAMRAAGHRSMREAALELVIRGVTSLEEINRVLVDEDVPLDAEAPRTRPRVLMVDDDRVTRLIVKRLLEKEGYEVVEGVNGRQAVDLARRDRPDLLILDLEMPEMDGYAAIDAIRGDLTFATLPVMVLTAQSETGVEERVLELGADDYLTKPIEPGVLVSRVRAVFKRASRLAA